MPIAALPIQGMAEGAAIAVADYDNDHKRLAVSGKSNASTWNIRLFSNVDPS
ncbi:MAG: hypothetical protein R3B93_22325 [Bacteroidia bacterium]